MESRDTVGGRGLTGPGWDGVQNGYTALYAASQDGHREVVEKLLEKGAGIDVQNKYGQTALMMASGMGHGEVVEKLLDKGASIDLQTNNGATALMLASQNGHGEVVEKLLEKGATVNVQDKVRGREGGMLEGRRGGAGTGGSAEGVREGGHGV